MNGLSMFRGLSGVRKVDPGKSAQIDRSQSPSKDRAQGGFVAPNLAAKAQTKSYKTVHHNFTPAANRVDILQETIMAPHTTRRDPVSMHLLMETAIGDSAQYEVLSHNDLDNMKREISKTSSRLDTARHELALATKVRDAARSIDRLPSASSKDFARPGSRGKGATPGRNSEELEQSARRCDELGQEVAKLEREEYQLQKSLLEHTAGVLQMTHKGYLKKDPTQDDIRQGHHIPGLDLDGEFGGLGQYALYEQVLQNELNGEQSTADLAGQHQMILDVERRVEDLNSRLRQMILELRPQKQVLPQPPRQLGDDPNNVGEVLFEQVGFLEECLTTVHNLQNTRGANSEAKTVKQSQLVLEVEQRMEDLNVQLRGIILDMKPRKEELPNPARELRDDPDNPEIILNEQVDFLEACLESMNKLLEQKREAGAFGAPEDKLEAFNNRLFELMTRHDPERSSKYFPPPQANGTTILDQFEYLNQGLKAVDRRLDELGEFEETSAEKLASYQDRAEQYVTVVGFLWDMFLARDREEAARAGQPPPQDNFSLQELSKKVQELHAKYYDMLDQKDVLTRQIQQQRDLSSTADTTRDQKMNSMREENEALKSQLQITSEEAAMHLEKLSLAIAECEAVKNTLSMRDEQQGISHSRALDEEARGRKLAEEQLAAQTALAVKAESSLKELESEVIRLQTELTIAKAELDSAHGTRAQRAAEAAGDPALQARVQTLQKELSETIADYESMTKATIEYEKEREKLENTADALRDQVESLEMQLSEEKINGMGAKSPGMESVRSAPGGTSVAVLKTEFKKMMRERTDEKRKLQAEYRENLKVRNYFECEHKLRRILMR